MDATGSAGGTLAARSTILLTLLLIGSLSCASRVTAPPPPTPGLDLRVEMTATPGAAPGDPVTIRAVIRNVGGVPVFLADECPKPSIRIHDDHGDELLLLDPTRPVACPAMMPAAFPAFTPGPTEPGTSVERSTMFEGVYYTDTGERRTAPAGTYKAVLKVPYSAPPGWEIRTLTDEVSFDWP